jgi:H+/Cl- antiporter ClcA
MVPISTRFTPASISAAAHGGVFLPSWPFGVLQGSKVTTAVSGRTPLWRASSRAIASACRPP